MGEVYSHLSEEERQVIRIEIGNGTSIRRIGLMLGRNASTVGREIERDTWFPSNENESCRPCRPKRLKTGPWTGGCYIAGTARRKTGRRRAEPRKRYRLSCERLWAARPVPRRLRHARVPGDRLPLDPRRPPSP